MNESKMSILVPIQADRRISRLNGQISSAACFAHWLGADLRVLVSPSPDIRELMRLEEKLMTHTPRECSFSIESDGKPVLNAALASIERWKPEMVILLIEPQLFRRSVRIESWQRQLLQASAVPVLIHSTATRLAPFESIMVPMKGEPMRTDAALSYSLQLGSRTRVPLDILHVSSRQGGEELSAVGQFSDEYYHEYPRRIEELIAEASPLASLRERTIIREFMRVRGDVIHEVFRGVKKHRAGLLVIEWDGKFARGRAEMIKAIFLASRRPVLVVKPVKETPSTLTLGGNKVAA